MRLRFACLALALLPACSAEAPVAGGVALRDPLGLVDDVYAAGHELRLYVLPADAYACDPASGTVAPDVPDSDERFEDAVVDVSLTRDELSSYMVAVPSGEWTVLARGKGTDPVSGRMNVFIATGCATRAVGETETVSVTVVLAPVAGEGECGDGLLSPDEQCETGDPACTDCRTVAEPMGTTTERPQTAPRVGAAPGQRVVVAWEIDASEVGFRLFSPEGRPLTGMGPLAVETTVALPFAQNAGGVAVAPDGRVAISLIDFPPSEDPPNVAVAFYDAGNITRPAVSPARADLAGAQTAPVIAFHSSGGAMVAFADAQSSTGLSGRVFTGTAPTGDEAFVVGEGSSGASAPSIAATASGFVVAFAAGNDVFFQRFGADGAPADAAAVRVGDPGARSQPAVGSLGDSFLVAWTVSNAPGDGMGTGVLARIFAADGAAISEPFLVNSTVADDQDAPAVAAAGGRYLVAFESGSTVRARAFAATGDPWRNRERPISLGDFELAPAGARPSAAAIGTGADLAWLVVWEGPGVDGTDVFGRSYPL